MEKYMFTLEENIALRTFIEIQLRNLDTMLKFQMPGEYEEISEQTINYVNDRKKELNNLLFKIENLTK